LSTTEPAPAVLAGRGRRLGAYVLDITMLVLLRVFSLPFRANALLSFVFTLGLAVLTVAQIILLSTRGQSIGKLILNRAIVDRIDHQPPGFLRAALFRQLPTFVLAMVYPPAALLYALVDALVIFGSARRCLHDYIVGTIVIDLERSGQPVA